mgnify:FL=1
MVIYNAYKKGCRLDAWEDHLRANLPLWKEAFDEAGYDVRNEILREHSLDEALPWDSVTLGPPKNYYKREWERNLAEVLTPKCMENCNHRCGVCNKAVETCLKDNKEEAEREKTQCALHTPLAIPQCNIPIMYRAVFAFSKSGGAEFISHLGQVEIFNKALLKSRLPVIYTAGFNPLPRLEFATTLSLGLQSEEEIASVVLYTPVSEKDFMERLNKQLVRGLVIHACFIFPVSNLRKRESLSSSLWGNEYCYHFFTDDKARLPAFLHSESAEPFMQASSLCRFTLSDDGAHLQTRLLFSKDRAFRDALEAYFGKKNWEFVQITKTHTLAKPVITGCLPADTSFLTFSDNLSVSYFELYTNIAAVNKALMEERNRVG